MSDELDRLRRAARAEGCEVTPVPAVPISDAVRPAASKCDPVTPVTAEEYFPPAPVPEPSRTDKRLPNPLVVSGPATSSECPGGQSGTAGTVAAGEFTDLFYWESVPMIPRSELYRLLPLVGAVQTFIDVNLPLLDTETITPEAFDTGLFAITFLEDVVLEALRAALTAAYDSLRDTVAEVASQRRSCSFQSLELWVLCDPDETIGYEVVYVEPVSGTYAHSAASAASSSISQDEADAAAVTEAALTLSCVYGNTEITLDCTSIDASFVNALDTAVKVGATPYTTLADLSAAGYEAFETSAPGTARPLVYTVTIPAGTYFGRDVTQADAIATSAAQAALDCFWPSPETVVDCTDISTDFQDRVDAMIANNTWALAITNDAEAKVALWSEMQSGSHTPTVAPPINVGIAMGELDRTPALVVALPSGMFVADTTQADASVAALSYARGLLECAWVSPEHTCACAEPPATVALKDALSDDSFTLAQGSYTDTAFPDTDITAELPWADSLEVLCSASITCVYCNEAIAPTCAAAINATVGLSADKVCRSSAQEVLDLAGPLASIPPAPADPSTDCIYPNDEQTGTCVQWAEGTGIFSTVRGSAAALTANTAGAASTAPAAMFTAASTALANEAAKNFVRSSLVCAFGRTATAVCDYLHDLRERMVDGTFNYDTATSRPWHPARGVTHPLPSLLDASSPTPPAGWPSLAPGTPSLAFRYAGQRALFILQAGSTAPSTAVGELTTTAPEATGYGISFALESEALTLAEAEAQGQLKCVYTNWPRLNMMCPNSARVPRTTGYVEMGTIQAASTQAANAIAEQASISGSGCFESDAAFGLTFSLNAGGGGGSGVAMGEPSAEISGKCFGCQTDDSGETVTYKFWGLEGSQTEMEENLGDGSHHIFSKVECEAVEGGAAEAPCLRVWDQPTTDAVWEDGYYPTTAMEELRKTYPNAQVFYVGAVVVETGQTVGTGASDSGRAYQHQLGSIQMMCGKGILPFEPIEIKDVGLGNVGQANLGFEVIMREGLITDVITTRGEVQATKHIDPEVDGKSMKSRPRPFLQVKPNESAILYYETGVDGTVKTDPKPRVRVGNDEVATIHYQPKDPNDPGLEGKYAIKLWTLKVVNDKPEIEPFHLGHWVHYHDLPTLENVGIGARGYRGRCGDAYQFRSNYGRHGVLSAEDGDVINYDFDAENVGYEGVSVYVDPATLTRAKAQFRRLKELDPGDDPQVRVSIDAGGGILIRGNSKNGSLLFEDCSGSTVFTLSWEDGLITNDVGATVQLGSCDGSSSTPPSLPP